MSEKVIKMKTDDELVLEEQNDSILEKALDYAIVEQNDENILAYSVTGIYTNENNEKYISVIYQMRVHMIWNLLKNYIMNV